MDAIFFGVKRGYYATLRYSWKQLARFGITPARFDVLRVIYDREDGVAQDYLRGMMCVARSTMSRMMLALVRLGWVKRKREPYDGRTYWCELTPKGESLVCDVMQSIVNSRIVADAVDGALAPTIGRERQPDVERLLARSLFQRLSHAFAQHKFGFGMPHVFWESSVSWKI